MLLYLLALFDAVSLIRKITVPLRPVTIINHRAENQTTLQVASETPHSSNDSSDADV